MKQFFKLNLIVLLFLSVLITGCDKDKDDVKNYKVNLIGTWVCTKKECLGGPTRTYNLSEQFAKITFYEGGGYFPHSVQNYDNSITWKCENSILELIANGEVIERFQIQMPNSSTLILKYIDGITTVTYSKIK